MALYFTRERVCTDAFLYQYIYIPKGSLRYRCLCCGLAVNGSAGNMRQLGSLDLAIYTGSSKSASE
jgi:hypothetical protein